MADTIIALEDESVTQDVILAGTSSDSQIVLTTALIATGNPLDRTKLIEIQLEYEADEEQLLMIEYSEDGGANWSSYSTITVDETTGPSILSVRNVIVGHNMQLRIVSDTIGRLRILSFVPRVLKDARVRS